MEFLLKATARADDSAAVPATGRSLQAQGIGRSDYRVTDVGGLGATWITGAPC
jgi:hypothetical protein